jgi:hypothetical protein
MCSAKWTLPKTKFPVNHIGCLFGPLLYEQTGGNLAANGVTAKVERKRLCFVLAGNVGKNVEDLHALLTESVCS